MQEVVAAESTEQAKNYLRIAWTSIELCKPNPAHLCSTFSPHIDLNVLRFVWQSPSENTPIDRNVCFDSQTIVKTSEVDHNYLRTTDQYAMPTSQYTKVSTSKSQSLLKTE